MFAYFQDLNKRFRHLRKATESWAKNRGHFSRKQEREMFRLFLKIDEPLAIIAGIAEKPANARTEEKEET